MATGKLLYMREPRQATWLELFFDLIFVVALGKLTHLLAHAHHGHLDPGVWPKFILTFVPMWWIWVGHTVYNNRFDADTRPHRVATLLLMFLMMLASAFASDIAQNHAPFVLLYGLSRLFIVGMYVAAGRAYPDKAPFAHRTAATFGLGALISMSAAVLPLSFAVFVFYAGILFDMVGRKYIVGSTIPVDRDHLVERMGLLAIILLGESVISLAGGLTDMTWTTMTVIPAVAGFACICLIWWMYFDSFPLLIESKRDVNGDAILYSQLLTYLSFAILANSIGHAILNDLAIGEFRIMTMAGIVLFYLGKQIAYYVNRPEYRKFILVNTAAVFGVCALSMALPMPQYILLGVVSSIMLYIGLNVVAQVKLYGRVNL